MLETASQRIEELLLQKPTVIHIAQNGVWSAELQGGAVLFSYEKLDYHTGCRALLEGVKKAGIPFVNHSTIPI